MVHYPTELNFGDPCGRYCGPTGEETAMFPSDVFLDGNEYEHFNAQVYLKHQVEAQRQFADSYPGQPNIYDQWVREGLQRLHDLPPLPKVPCGSTTA
jgi:hypothetical protein